MFGQLILAALSAATGIEEQDALRSAQIQPDGLLEAVVLVDGQPRTLRLTPHSIRSTNYKAYSSGSGETREVEPAPVATYRGYVLEEPEALVGAAFRNGRLNALVDYPDMRPDFSIEPPAAGERLHRYQPVERLEELGLHFCGVAHEHSHAEDIGQSGGGTWASTSGIPVLQVALDADFQQFVVSGSSISATQDALETLLLYCSLIYEKEVGMRLEASISNVWVNVSHPLYPYSMPSCSGGSPLYGNCMAPFWSQSFLPERDIIHAIIGGPPSHPDIIVGLAPYHAPCSTLTPTYTNRWGITGGPNLPLASRALVMTHEIGHNMGLAHSPNGIPGIMQAGISTDFFFWSNHKTQLATKINQLINSNCLDDFLPARPAPTLLSVSPTAVPVKGSAQVTVTGTNLDTVVEIQIDGISHGLDRIQHLSSTQLLLTLKPVPATGLGNRNMTLLGAGGVGVGQINLVETNPIVLEVDTMYLPPFAAFMLNSFAGAGDVVAYGMATTSQTTSYGTWNILTGWSPIGVTTLDAIGFSSQLQYVCPPALIGVTIYMQAIGTDAGGNRQSTVPTAVCMGC